MTQEEFIEWLNSFAGDVFKPWKIQVGTESAEELTLGCFLSDIDSEWKVYENGERGSHYIAYETESEQEAFTMLRSKAETLLERRKWFY